MCGKALVEAHIAGTKQSPRTKEHPALKIKAVFPLTMNLISIVCKAKQKTEQTKPAQ